MPQKKVAGKLVFARICARYYPLSQQFLNFLLTSIFFSFCSALVLIKILVLIPLPCLECFCCLSVFSIWTNNALSVQDKTYTPEYWWTIPLLEDKHVLDFLCTCFLGWVSFLQKLNPYLIFNPLWPYYRILFDSHLIFFTRNGFFFLLPNWLSKADSSFEESGLVF